MNVLNFAYNIYNHEVVKNPDLKDKERIIYVSALLHDMCDKKYMDEKCGIIDIQEITEDDRIWLQTKSSAFRVSKKFKC
jgi:hypothetical protein